MRGHARTSLLRAQISPALRSGQPDHAGLRGAAAEAGHRRRLSPASGHHSTRAPGARRIRRIAVARRGLPPGQLAGPACLVLRAPPALFPRVPGRRGPAAMSGPDQHRHARAWPAGAPAARHDRHVSSGCWLAGPARPARRVPARPAAGPTAAGPARPARVSRVTPRACPADRAARGPGPAADPAGHSSGTGRGDQARTVRPPPRVSGRGGRERAPDAGQRTAPRRRPTRQPPSRRLRRRSRR